MGQRKSVGRPSRAVAGVAILVALGAIPVGAAGARTSPDDSEPAASDGSSAPADLELHVNLMLGLMPDAEADAYWAQQEADAQLAIQACMDSAGFDYLPEDLSEAVDPLAEVPPLEFAQRWGFGIWTMMDPSANPYGEGNPEFTPANAEAVAALSPADQEAWYQANQGCQRDAYAAVEAYSAPWVQQALENFFTDVDADPRVDAAVVAWSECMAAAGFTFASLEEMYDHLYGANEEVWQEQEQFYASAAWEPESPDHEQWQANVDEEIAIAVANATCEPALQEVRLEVAAELRPQLVAVLHAGDWESTPAPSQADDTTLVATSVP